MSIYKFRVILDDEDDVFRDIAIADEDSLEDLHNAIVNAFDFDGMEPASFYSSDDQWSQGEEISLFDTGDVPGEAKIMADYQISEWLSEDMTKMIYVYDYINMWTFFVELAAIDEPELGTTYPNLLFSHGIVPAIAPEKKFVDESENLLDFDEDGYDEEDFDQFDSGENFEDYGFEENWN